jgi:hypothetical protein
MKSYGQSQPESIPAAADRIGIAAVRLHDQFDKRVGDDYAILPSTSQRLIARSLRYLAKASETLGQLATKGVRP